MPVDHCTCDCHSCCVPLDQSCESCRDDHKDGDE